MIQKLAEYLFADAIYKGVAQYNHLIETFGLHHESQRTRN